jgi:hypothetical protein
MESIAEQREWNESMRRKAEEIEAELPWEAGLDDEQGVYSGMFYLFPPPPPLCVKKLGMLILGWA